jgi:hypothetical protein
MLLDSQIKKHAQEVISGNHTGATQVKVISRVKKQKQYYVNNIKEKLVNSLWGIFGEYPNLIFFLFLKITKKSVPTKYSVRKIQHFASFSVLLQYFLRLTSLNSKSRQQTSSQFPKYFELSLLGPK